MSKEDLMIKWRQMQLGKEEFGALWKELDNQQLQWKPTEGWSIVQVMGHILFSEAGTLGYMKKKTTGGWESLEETTAENNAISQQLNERLASSDRYKAPSILPEPTNEETAATLLEKWNNVRDELEEFLMNIDAGHYKKLVFRQPIAGMLNILQTLDFLDNHLRHHFMQVERIKTEQGI